MKAKYPHLFPSDSVSASAYLHVLGTQFSQKSGRDIVTPQKSDLDCAAENTRNSDSRQGSGTVKGTTVRRPVRGSHPPSSGGPRSPPQAVDHLTSRGKARGSLGEPTRTRRQTTEPFTGCGLNDGPWWRPSS
ncbi:hypothetical protein MTR67_036339 [Solanum verrucosum]|uniref:Uncharacterized protein n=1 Tax=Solanum verrucosum TaxID=315347 RepID=A0AAF0UBV9_SOLVR|nr:hypothetical protein MTR67_036339 [Solanum verrucosum]